jgi:hypothetical protein
VHDGTQRTAGKGEAAENHGDEDDEADGRKHVALAPWGYELPRRRVRRVMRSPFSTIEVEKSLPAANQVNRPVSIHFR